MGWPGKVAPLGLIDFQLEILCPPNDDTTRLMNLGIFVQ